jgi:hypothetical protein
MKLTVRVSVVINKHGKSRYKINISDIDKYITVYRTAMCSFSMAQIKKPMLLMGIDIDKDMWEITDSTYSDDRQERIMILSKKELT